MGILVPEHFPLHSLANDDERRVVEAFRDGLTDGWVVIPDVGVSSRRDHQMDLVLAHADEGVLVIEVKGHRPKVDQGVWMAHGRPMDPQPLKQAADNAYALRDALRSAVPGLERLSVEYGVVFPNAELVLGQLPTGVHEAQVLTSSSLDDPQEAVERLISHRWGNSRLGSEALEAIVRYLRPDAEFSWDAEARARFARQRLEQICGQHVRALERLDANRRVVVTGAAGTGKTRLAMAWARRAFVRQERVLLTCFNEPLAGEMRGRLPEDDRLVVGAFYDVALALEGMPEIEIPEDADADFWDHHAFGHIHRYIHHVTRRFDTIVIDEAQDFSPAWIVLLEQLLDPRGPRRVLMVADEAQVLFQRGFRLPSADDGWTRCELVYNCRNTSRIASLLRRQLQGAPPAPVAGPETIGVRWLEVTDDDSVLQHVGAEIDRIIDGEGADPQRVLVATFHRALRDRLREQFAFVPWEGGEATTIICETVHRVKGLEFDHVILVASLSCTYSDELLYVGVSRAVSQLSVVAPRALGQRLGLEASPA